ncbi:MAG: hypothetical protein J4432_00125 [DPANN group archaeon]|nr:hypothetical protein [DPANN group archaeon]
MWLKKASMEQAEVHLKSGNAAVVIQIGDTDEALILDPAEGEQLERIYPPSASDLLRGVENNEDGAITRLHEALLGPYNEDIKG